MRNITGSKMHKVAANSLLNDSTRSRTKLSISTTVKYVLKVSKVKISSRTTKNQSSTSRWSSKSGEKLCLRKKNKNKYKVKKNLKKYKGSSPCLNLRHKLSTIKKSRPRRRIRKKIKRTICLNMTSKSNPKKSKNKQIKIPRSNR